MATQLETDSRLAAPEQRPGPHTLENLVNALYPSLTEEDLPAAAEHISILLNEGLTVQDLLALKQIEQTEKNLALESERLELERKQAKATQTQAEIAKAAYELERAKTQRREARRAQNRLVRIRQLPFEEQIASWNRDDIEEVRMGHAHSENLFALIASAQNLRQQLRIIDWLDLALNISSPQSAIDYKRQEAEHPRSVWSQIVRQMDIPDSITSWAGLRAYLKVRSDEA